MDHKISNDELFDLAQICWPQKGFVGKGNILIESRNSTTLSELEDNRK